MCGIVGIVGSDINYQMKDVFKDLLKLDTIRGVHSTGMLTVDNFNNVNVFKKSVDGITFTDLKRYDRTINRVTNPRLLLGHNRAATTGRVNDANAHPFSDGGTHLVHNGTLVSYNSLHKSSETNVDSEAICYQVEHTGIIDTVSKLNGAFALASYNERTRQLSIIRNSQRPMCLAKVKGKDVTIFASEEHFIKAAALRNNVELDEEGVWYLKEQVLLNFNLQSINSVGTDTPNYDVKFYEPPPPINRGNYVKKPAKDLTTSSNVTVLHGKEKRTAATKAKLKEFGLTTGDNIVGQVGKFKYFLKEDTKGKEGRGTVTLTYCNPEDSYGTQKILTYAITYGEYMSRKDEFIWCKVVGITEVKEGDAKCGVTMPLVQCGNLLTATELETFWLLFDWETPQEPKEAVAVDGKECSLSHFKARTKDGCSVCSNPIPPEDSPEILWALNEPLCKTCTTDFAYKSHNTGFSIEELLTT